MEVEESFDALFKDCNFESAELLPLARKCIAESPGEKEVLRALEISLCFCLKQFDVEDFEEEIFRIACPAAKNIVAEKLGYLERNQTSCVQLFNVVLEILSYFQRVYEYLNEIPKITIIELKSLLLCTCEILLSCFAHCKISEEVYGSLFNSLTECLSTFFKKCCDLQELLLTILTVKIECDPEDDREILLLDEVMTLLSKLGIIFINLEVKTMAKVWKTFAILIEKHLNCLKNNFSMGETIKDLCNSIMSNIETILSKNDQDLNKIVKLSCFLLKLVIKFSEIFIESLQNCQNSLLNLLLMLCKYDASVGDNLAQNQDLFTQLTIGTNPLVSVLMTDVKFIKECDKMSKENKNPIEFCVFCCLILKKLKDSFAATRSLWFNRQENILDWIFISASSSQFTTSDISLPNILVNGKQKKFLDLYEYVLVVTSAFLMTATADEFCFIEEKLIENILQSNPIRALLAIDMWCLLARFADSEVCFSQIQTLSKLFQEFHPQTLRVEKCYLGSVIRRLFPLLTGSHRSLFLKCFKPSFYAAVWEGVSFDGLSQNEVCDIRQTLMAEVDPVLDQTVVDLRIPAGCQNLFFEKFGSRISKFWKFNCDILSSTSQSLRFLKIISILTAGVVSEMPSEDLYMVLTQIKKLLSLGQPTCIKFFFIWILNSLSTVRIPSSNSQKKILTIIAEIFRALLSSKQVLIKQKAFETFYSFSHVTSHGEIISLTVQNAPDLKMEITNYFKNNFPEKTGFRLTEYMRELQKLKFEHVCPVLEPCRAEIPIKKVKICPDNLEETVVRWKEDAKMILEYFHSLSELRKMEIKNVCDSVLSLTV